VTVTSFRGAGDAAREKWLALTATAIPGAPPGGRFSGSCERGELPVARAERGEETDGSPSSAMVSGAKIAWNVSLRGRRTSSTSCIDAVAASPGAR
jgi:hypothetical protein